MHTACEVYQPVVYCILLVTANWYMYIGLVLHNALVSNIDQRPCSKPSSLERVNYPQANHARQ